MFQLTQMRPSMWTTPPPPPGIHQFMDSLGLINLASTLNTQFETHKGGRCIDYCMVSPNILPSVKAFGFLSYDRITTTNHRPYFLDLHIPTLFVHTPDSPVTPSSRLLKSYLPQRKKICGRSERKLPKTIPPLCSPKASTRSKHQTKVEFITTGQIRKH